MGWVCPDVRPQIRAPSHLPLTGEAQARHREGESFFIWGLFFMESQKEHIFFGGKGLHYLKTRMPFACTFWISALPGL